MASDDSSGSRPAPIVLRIKLRYDDVEVMVQRFAANVGKSGLFLPTKSLQPIGTELKFELRLSDDTPVLVGLGRVRTAHAPDPRNPRATFGMAIELSRVTPQSRALILRMLERRRQLGLPDTALPSVADIDAGRRAETAEPVAREPANEPVAAVAPAVSPAVAPAVSSAVVPAAVPPGDGLLTSPRRPTGPMAAVKLPGVAPLGPEPPRATRIAISALIERASGPIASGAVAVPGLDEEVDVAGAIARARTLAQAGRGLDAELAALSEQSAAPLEISVEGASAELARQLGGHAVRRDRTAREERMVASEAEAAPAAIASPAHGVAASDAAGVEPVDAAGVEPVDAAGVEPVDAAPTEHATEASPEEPAAQAEEPTAQAEEPAARAEAPPAPAEEPPVAPAPIKRHDSIELALDAALDAILLGSAEPVPGLALAPEPAAEAPAAEAPAEAPPAASVLDALGIDEAEHTELGAIPQSEELAEPGAGPADSQDRLAIDLALLAERHLPRAESDYAELVATAASSDDEHARGEPAGGSQAGAFGDQLEPAAHELEDFEILAEADAEDEDLLMSHGQREVGDLGRPRASSPPLDRPPSELDFAARLDLGDDGDDGDAREDSDAGLALPEDEDSASHTLDDLSGDLHDRGGLDSAGRALAAFGLDDKRATPDDALEHALDALDVDLDDLSAPAPRLLIELPRPRPARPLAPPAHRVARHVVPRPASDDGIVIDLDDED